MRKFTKAVAVASALVAPIAIGWTYTADASIGEQLGFTDGNHDIDEFEMDGYSVYREEVDGVVTELTVTDPDGNVVDEAEIPESVQSHLDNWQRPMADAIQVVEGDGTACYVVTDLENDGEWNQSGSNSAGLTFALRGGEGLDTEAVYSTEPIDDSDLVDHVASGDPLMDLPGAVEMSECQN